MYTTPVIPSQQLGFKTLTASTLLTAERPRFGRNDASEAVYSRNFRSPYPDRLPPWMVISRSFEFGPRQRRSAVSTLVVPHAEVRSNAGNIAGNFCHGGLLVRGGGATTAASSFGEASLGVSPLGATLLATACVSAALEHRTKAGAVIGAPLISFGTFCLLSNLGLVPSTDALYDLCWSFLLPLSLAIIILASPVSADRDPQRSDQAQFGDPAAIVDKPARGSMGPVGRVGLAFTLGAVGSIVGVLAAFRVATSHAGAGGMLTLPRETAAQIAGAVTATYIGGSVNLFAVAAAVGLVGAMSAGGASLLGALAASDVFLMALYFSGLVAANKATSLRRIFPGEARLLGSPFKESTLHPSGSGARNQGEASCTAELMAKGDQSLFKSRAITTVSLLGLGSVICLAGKAAARRSPVPGTSTMAVTLLTVAVTRTLVRYAPSFQSSLARDGPTLATVLLNVFFGSVGAAGRWAQVVGVAPAIFAFASLALVLHAVLTVVGAAVLNKFCGAGLGIDDIIVASNANIGGPSTAATFAGLIGQDELVIPAAVWGTVGYAIATTLGVGIWAVLR